MKGWFRALLARMLEHQVRRLIKRHHPGIVAVGGSVGKTSTRMAVVAMLSQKFRTQSIAQPGYNSEIGLPLSVFELDVPRRLYNPFAWLWRIIETEAIIQSEYRHQMLVLEVGTDQPGEIARSLRFLKPDVGVITAVTPEHMQNFPGGLDEVAAEELLLAPASRKLVVGRDDIPGVYRRKYLDAHRDLHTYGSASDDDYQIKIEATSPTDGTTGQLLKNRHVVVGHLKLRLFGLQSVKTAVAAYAVGDQLGLTKKELASGLEKIRATRGRMRVFAGVNGSTILDDSYNSSPEALAAALDAVMKTKVAGRRIAILGSMNELGMQSPRYHEAAGVLAAGVDVLVTVGGLASGYLGPAAVRAGLDPTRFQVADSPQAAGEYVKLLLRPGDLVLVKGSQDGVYAEEASKILLENPADGSYLVRQSPEWLRRKAKSFPARS